MIVNSEDCKAIYLMAYDTPTPERNDDSKDQSTQMAFNFFIGALGLALLVGLIMLIQTVLLS